MKLGGLFAGLLGAASLAATASPTPSPVQASQVSNCIGWRYVQGSDTCANIVSRYASPPVSLTLANFLKWNPALKSDCSGLVQKYYVCVQVGAASTTTTTTTTRTTTTRTTTRTPTRTTTRTATTTRAATTTTSRTTARTTTASTTTASPTPLQTPSPIQSGQVSGCLGWRYVAVSDTCTNIVSRFAAAPVSLTLSNLLKWNPALKSDCSGLAPKYFVCVQVGASVTSTSVSKTSSDSYSVVVVTPTSCPTFTLSGVPKLHPVYDASQPDSAFLGYTNEDESDPRLLGLSRNITDELGVNKTVYYNLVDQGSILATLDDGTNILIDLVNQGITVKNSACDTEVRVFPTTNKRRDLGQKRHEYIPKLSGPKPVVPKIAIRQDPSLLDTDVSVEMKDSCGDPWRSSPWLHCWIDGSVYPGGLRWRGLDWMQMTEADPGYWYGKCYFPEIHDLSKDFVCSQAAPHINQACERYSDLGARVASLCAVLEKAKVGPLAARCKVVTLSLTLLCKYVKYAREANNEGWNKLFCQPPPPVVEMAIWVDGLPNNVRLLGGISSNVQPKWDIDIHHTLSQPVCTKSTTRTSSQTSTSTMSSPTGALTPRPAIPNRNIRCIADNEEPDSLDYSLVILCQYLPGNSFLSSCRKWVEDLTTHVKYGYVEYGAPARASAYQSEWRGYQGNNYFCNYMECPGCSDNWSQGQNNRMYQTSSDGCVFSGTCCAWDGNC